MSYKIFIDGRSGTTGLHIAERLASRDDIVLVDIPEDLRKDIDARLECIESSDIAILCLPDAGAREIAEAHKALAGSGAAASKARIIDASTAHRVADGWVYGMPEIDKAGAIASATYVANPGCHATGFIMAVKPLVEAGIIAVDAILSCYSLTGFSGGGKSMIADYGETPLPTGLVSPRLYGLGQTHKHLPEMRRYTGLGTEPIFSPIVSDFYAGMLVGTPLAGSMLAKKASPGEIREIIADYYAGRPLIHVREIGEEMQEANGGGFLSANTFANRDDLEILVTGNDDRILLVSRYDNLGKGASGSAIQNMNIMLGLPEATGLEIGS